jgi:hypothetical protein
MASLLSFGWARPGIIEDTVRDFNEPDDPAKAALCCACLPDFGGPVVRRRLVGRRILAGGGLKDVFLGRSRSETGMKTTSTKQYLGYVVDM